MAAAWFRSLLLPAATEREAPKGAILCEGYLWKQKALSHQMWQKRYFFLRTDGLFYSDHPTFSHKMTSISLHLAHIGAADYICPRKFTWGVLSPRGTGRMYVMACDCAADVVRWVNQAMQVRDSFNAEGAQPLPRRMRYTSLHPEGSQLPILVERSQDEESILLNLTMNPYSLPPNPSAPPLSTDNISEAGTSAGSGYSAAAKHNVYRNQSLASASASLSYQQSSSPYAPGHVRSNRQPHPRVAAGADKAGGGAEVPLWLMGHSPARHLPFEGAKPAAATSRPVATAPPLSFESLQAGLGGAAAADEGRGNYLSDDDVSACVAGGIGGRRVNYLSDSSDGDDASDGSNRSQSPQWRLKP